MIASLLMANNTSLAALHMTGRSGFMASVDLVNNTQTLYNGNKNNDGGDSSGDDNDFSGVAWKAASGVVALLIILVNSTVLTLFLSKAKLRKSTTNRILMSLVTSDLVTGLVFAIHFTVSFTPSLSYANTPATVSCRIFLDILTSWMQLVTMGNLSLIIFERYITLIYPYKLDIFLTAKRIRMAIYGVWIVPFFVPCIQLAWVHRFMTTPTNTIPLKVREQAVRADSIFSALTILIFVLLPMTAFFVIFVRMFREIQKFPSISELFNKKQEEKRVLKIFAVMYSLFVIFSLPYFLVRLLMDLQEAGHYNVSVTTSLLVIFLKSVPPLINPFVYVLNKPDFRRELKRRRDMLTHALDRHTRFSSLITMSRRPSNDPSSLNLNPNQNNNNNNNEFTATTNNNNENNTQGKHNNNTSGDARNERHSTTYNSDSTAFHSTTSSTSNSSTSGGHSTVGILFVKTKAIFAGTRHCASTKEQFL